MNQNSAQPFAFGENWASFARTIDDSHVEQAIAGLAALLGHAELRGKRFLDIGSGSGIHSAAALRLGASEVLAVDVDPASAATTRQTLKRFCPVDRWSVEEQSVFDMTPEALGTFDIVYSWGVLHHTGDLERALQSAAALVAPGGLFAVALYRKTALCPLWKLEKRWYANASPNSQERVLDAFIGFKRFLFKLFGRNFDAYVASYKSRRGMSYRHDQHDWLGGWPYQSMSPNELDRSCARLGLESHKKNAKNGYILGRRWTELGSGCDEFVYRKRSSTMP